MPHNPFHAIATLAPKRPEEPVRCLKPLTPLEPVHDDHFLSFEDQKAKQFSEGNNHQKGSAPPNDSAVEVLVGWHTSVELVPVVKAYMYTYVKAIYLSLDSPHLHPPI